jgi:hypothetical protein
MGQKTLGRIRRSRLQPRSRRYFCGSILEEDAKAPEARPTFLCGSYTRMSSEPLPEHPADSQDQSDLKPLETAELPGALSKFTQWLASFGLGESPDPLLTDTRPPAKRRASE